MTDVTLTCGIGSFFYQDQRGNTVSMVGGISSSQKNETIKRNDEVNFPCNLGGMIHYEVPMISRGPRVNAPRESAHLTVTYMDTTVTVDYTTAYFWRRSYKADRFSWDRDAKGFHWMRGKVIR